VRLEFNVKVMMMVLCPKAGSLAFTPLGDEIIEVVSHCLSHRQLWVSNLSKVATQWLEPETLWLQGTEHTATPPFQCQGTDEYSYKCVY